MRRQNKSVKFESTYSQKNTRSGKSSALTIASHKLTQLPTFCLLLKVSDIRKNVSCLQVLLMLAIVLFFIDSSH